MNAASSEGSEGGLFLSRDTATIGLREVVEHVCDGESATAASDVRVVAMIDRLRQAEGNVLHPYTVKDLVEHFPSSGISTRGSLAHNSP
jgi:DNA-binding IscR family transcriptional regulator